MLQRAGMREGGKPLPLKVAFSQKVQGSFFTSQNCHGNYSEKLPWTFPATFLNLKLSMIKNLPLQI